MRTALAVLALCLACEQAAAPQPGPRAEQPAPVKAEAAPPVKPAVTQQPVVAPAPDVVWWCTCYARADGVPLTACRRTVAECQRLEDRALYHGGDGISAGSASHACREVRGAHPADVLGERARWRPSKKSGAWLGVGACLLAGPSDIAAPPYHIDPDRYVRHRETFGGLRLGMTSTAVTTLLGPPEHGPVVSEVHLGLYEQEWSYPRRGLELVFRGYRDTGPWVLERFEATPPCDLRTSRGVGLGDSRTSVEAIYGPPREIYFPDTDTADPVGPDIDAPEFFWPPDVVYDAATDVAVKISFDADGC